MNEFENLQRLLRLKRYETPGEDFVDDFVFHFRERQRSEMLRQSARGLLWERVNTFFSDLVSPKWATASATAAFAVVAAWGTLGIMGSAPQGRADFQLASTNNVPAILQKQPSLAVESELIKNIQTSADEVLPIEGILLSRHFEGDELAGLSGGLTPVSAELMPIGQFDR